MSGPVWRLIRNEPSTCSECGRTISTYRAVGKVVDSVFVITKKYCDACYGALDRFLSEVA